MDESKIFNERLTKIYSVCKENSRAIYFILLAAVISLATWIRTRSLYGLRDVTTGGWTLGPDLDPFLFLRWAKYIVANGSLYAVDMLRNFPLGYHTNAEFVFLPYLISWFHKFASVFGSTSVEQSAVLFPVFMFIITIIAFFLFVRKLFIHHLGYDRASLIAIISSLFLSVIPALLPRTIAGIPEKESAAFFFMFLAFYFFLNSWSSKSRRSSIIHSILAALSTAGIGLIWGGVLYVFVTISIAFFIAFLLGQTNVTRQISFVVWYLVTILVVMPFSSRYSLSSIITSESTSIPLVILLIIFVNFLFTKLNIKDKLPHKLSSNLPTPILVLISSAVLGLILITIVQGPSAVISRLMSLIMRLINPFTQTRFNITVAENRMPFFSEWAGSFGPSIGSLPILFWLFFFGSIYLFYHMIHSLDKKQRVWLTSSYSFFLFALIFSRFKQDSLFNGENTISNLFYFGGMLFLAITSLYWYIKNFKNNKMEDFGKIDFGMLMLFSLFFLSVVSARGGIRLIMLLVPPASIIISYLLVQVAHNARFKNSGMKSFSFVLFGLILIASVFSVTQYTSLSIATAASYVPSSYTQQWQYAMSWVRDNAPENSVFAHWWDYGYWVQSMGERATILDGGNALVYWNHLLGRYVLTGSSEKDSLQFLYAHNATHLLIDSTDIGKYPAFSSIGSNENYDRYSWLNSFVKDPAQTQERKNSSVNVYLGSFVFDGDLVYKYPNGTTLFIPNQRGGIGGITIERDSLGNIISQPQAVAVYQGRQYILPLRYAFDKELIDFGSGLDAGIFIVPSLQATAQGVSIENDGALIYLSNKTVNSQFAKLYLYGQETPYFNLELTQDDPVISQLRLQGLNLNDFIYYGGVRGPIKIWSVSYPNNIVFNSSYLETTFPDSKLEVV